MNDLTKRLRDCASGFGDFKTDRGDFGLCDDAADEIERLRDALVRIQDLTQHDMGMSAADERCVHKEATRALSQKERND